MKMDTLIDILSSYEKKTNKNTNKDIFRSYQQQYLDGYAGVISNILNDKYELYIYIKNRDRIVSPLLLWKTTSKEKAISYYEKLVEVIKSQDYNVLIGLCQSGL